MRELLAGLEMFVGGWLAVYLLIGGLFFLGTPPGPTAWEGLYFVGGLLILSGLNLFAGKLLGENKNLGYVLSIIAFGIQSVGYKKVAIQLLGYGLTGLTPYTVIYASGYTILIVPLVLMLLTLMLYWKKIKSDRKHA